MLTHKKSIDKNQKKAFVISIVSHGLLLILFFMIAAWTEPDPPIPEYGIELAFIGEPAKSVSTKNAAANKPAEDPSPKPPVEEQTEDVDENVESTENAVAVEAISEDGNSPDVVDEEIETDSNDVEEQEENALEEEVIEQEEEEGVEDVEENATEEIEDQETEQLEEQEELPELDERAIFNNDGATGSESGGGSNVSGSSLDMSGWQWDDKPEPDDKSTENGKIIFQITVDGEGEIVAIKTIEKTVSPIVEKVYKNAVMDLTFSKTANNKSVAANSTGIITFIIQSR